MCNKVTCLVLAERDEKTLLKGTRGDNINSMESDMKETDTEKKILKWKDISTKFCNETKNNAKEGT